MDCVCVPYSFEIYRYHLQNKNSYRINLFWAINTLTLTSKKSNYNGYAHRDIKLENILIKSIEEKSVNNFGPQIELRLGDYGNLIKIENK